MHPPPRLDLLIAAPSTGYALLDSGAGRKLERFGKIILDRPEAQALWQPAISRDVWARAHAVFSASGEDEEKGRWRVDKPVPDQWPVAIDGVTVVCRLQGLWHVGLFPEQQPHWRWMVDEIKKPRDGRARVLNLFGYTGAASLIAAQQGAEVTHVDASKKAVQWAKDNQALSGLSEAPIRWMVDDAAKFTAREVRRGRAYDVIVIDPPKFGRGPEGEVWDLFTNLPALLNDCAKLLAPGSASLIFTSYAIRASALAFAQLLQEILASRGGAFETGELAIAEEGGRFNVPTSLFVRWRSEA